MTTEDDFQALLDQNREDWQTMLIFADWLEDRGDPRAEGYRAMGMCHVIPSAWSDKEYRHYYLWCADSYGRDFPSRTQRERVKVTHHNDSLMAMLPRSWFDILPNSNGEGLWRDFYGPRRTIDDRLALAFAELPAEERKRILSLVKV